MKFTRLIAITALFSISGSAKSTVLRGPNAEITLDESPRDKHMPAEDQRFLNGCDPKCPGRVAWPPCEGVDQSKVGCGSCRGGYACKFATGTIGKGSCLGGWACEQATANIGDGSCLEEDSCRGAKAMIGDGSCRGGYACTEAKAMIGDGSCLEQLSCRQSSENIGDGSCRDYYACNRATGTIGKGSCLKAFACEQASGNIGDGSCLEPSSCTQFSGSYIGHGSCTALASCGYATGFSIGDGSCKGETSCYLADALIGMNSCNGKHSCTDATGIITDNKCNEDYECGYRHHKTHHDDVFTCMAASTGFTKVDQLHGTVEIKELQHLEVGDTIKGVNENKIKVDDCEVVSVSTLGNRTVFGNYTSDHYVLSADDNNTVAHGEDGEEENVEVFQVLSSCPLNIDESGKKTTFTMCARAIYDGGPMPWSVYVKIHKTLFSLVKESGVRDLSAFHDLDDAIQRLPGLCISGLTCAEEGDCGEFEAKMMDFISHDLVTDARKKVYDAFHHLGDASKEGSISFMVSKGLSGATASE